VSDIQWYYGKEDDRVGPLTERELKALIRSGAVKPTDWVWRAGMDNWAPASDVPDLWEEPPIGTIPMDRAEPTTSPLAIASLVCSLLGFMCCFITALAGVICGHVALGQIKREPHLYKGRELALAGLILGYIALALNAAYFIFVIIMGAAGGG